MQDERRHRRSVLLFGSLEEIAARETHMAQAAHQAVFSEKLDSFQPIQVCSLMDVDILVTELSPDDPLLQPYIQAGITVI